MPNQPLRADESKNARNIPPNGGKVSPEVKEAVGKTANDVIAVMNVKKTSVKGENWSPEDVVQAYNIMKNTSPELKTWFAHNENMDDMAKQIFEKIGPTSRYTYSRRKRDGKMYYVFREKTKGGISQTKFIFSLDANGQIRVEQSIKSPESEERFFQYHLQHTQQKTRKNRDYEYNHNFQADYNAPLPEILNDDEAVKQAFLAAYPSADGFQNISIERPENSNEILISGEDEGRTKVFSIRRFEKRFGEISLVDETTKLIIPLHLPKEAYGEIARFDGDALVSDIQMNKVNAIKQSLQNDRFIKKLVQEVMLKEYGIKKDKINIVRKENRKIKIERIVDGTPDEYDAIYLSIQDDGKVVLSGLWHGFGRYSKVSIDNNQFEVIPLS